MAHSPFQIGRLTGKALVLALGRGSTVLAQFAVNLMLVRWWMPEQFGEFHEIRVFVSAALMLELGLPTGLLQIGSGRNQAERELMYRRGVTVASLLGVIALIGFGIAAVFVSDPRIAYALIPAGILVAANIPSAAIESVLIVRNRHSAASISSAMAAVASFGLVAIALMIFPTLAGVYAALAIGAVARLIAYRALIGDGARLIGVWTTNALELIRISLGVSATRMFGMVSAWIDRAVVMTFFSASALGVYVAGAWEVPFMAIFFGAITAAIVPEMSDHWSAGRREDALAVWKGAVSRSAWLIFPLWIWALLWAPELIRVLFTNTYGDAVPIFRAYLVMLPLRVAVFGAFLVAIGEVRTMIVGAAIDVIVNLCASVVLAASVGMIGPALATALGTYAQVGYYLVFVRRHLELTFGAILPWRELAKAVIVAFVVIAPTITVRILLESDAVALVVSAVFVGTVFAILAYYGVGELFVRRSARAR